MTLQLFHLYYLLVILRSQLINKLYSKSVCVKYWFIIKQRLSHRHEKEEYILGLGGTSYKLTFALLKITY